MIVCVGVYQLAHFTKVEIPDGELVSLADVISRAGVPVDTNHQEVVRLHTSISGCGIRGLQECIPEDGEHYAVVPTLVGLCQNRPAVTPSA